MILLNLPIQNLLETPVWPDWVLLPDAGYFTTLDGDSYRVLVIKIGGADDNYRIALHAMKEHSVLLARNECVGDPEQKTIFMMSRLPAYIVEREL